jgi:hypothetical protein
MWGIYITQRKSEIIGEENCDFKSLLHISLFIMF